MAPCYRTLLQDLTSMQHNPVHSRQPGCVEQKCEALLPLTAPCFLTPRPLCCRT